MNHATARVAGGLLAMMLSVLPALTSGDEAPIAGTVKAVDGAARTLTVEARAQGKVRQVVIEVRPATRIVRFVREAAAARSRSRRRRSRTSSPAGR